MATETRFAHFPRWAAWLLLAGLAILIAAAALQPLPISPSAPRRDAAKPSDVKLYRAIVSDVQHGKDYYASAAAEQRARGYPTWPPQVIREPTETMLLAGVRTDGLGWAALIGLSLVTVAALQRGLAHADISPRLRLWGLVLGATGLGAACAPVAIYMHEAWACVLITLSLALRRSDRWALSIGAGLAACLFRETALPYLAVMAAFAAYDRRYREAAAWSVAIGLFAALFALHLHLAAVQHRPTDLSSRGWVRFGGLNFIIATARSHALFILAPAWTIAAALGASVLGYLGCRDRWISRCGLTLLVYIGLFAVVGRPDNDYWGLLYAPLISLGLAFAPVALRDLAVRAFGAPSGNALPWQALTSRGS